MKRIAWVIGINRYPFLKDSETGELLHLDKPASDAEALAHLLETYGDFEVHRLPKTDGGQQVAPVEVLKEKDLEQAIRQLFHPTSSPIPETALLYFAGHGLQKHQDGVTEGFLAPSDANPRKDKWGISLKWLRQILETSPVRQQIIWLDCCHSGELFNFASADFGEYEKGRDRCFIAASREFQSAYGGVLTPVLLQGLDPKNNPNRWVTNYTLKDFIEEALKNAPQHPVLTNSGGQIILTGMGGVRGNICPYRGLGYFDFNDEDPKYFYGRAALTKQLLEKVEKSNFLAVLGASGSGKSSAVRAGLLHQLKMGEKLPGSDRWKIYEPFTPGDRPLSSLEQVIGVKANQVEALIKAAAADRVVLVADQFEEVFTQCRDEAERQQFFECLMGAVKRLGNKLCLVLVMRSDFQGKCDEYTELAAKIDQNLVRVRQMSQEELREAIVKPAERVGLEIDRELVNQAISDVSGSPGDLPLLQYILTQLWEQRTLNRMTISDYTRLGGVKKALENHANLVYQNLSADEQLVAKQIFLELTHLGEGTEDTRQQVRQEDLVAEKRSSEIVERVVQRLAKEKLVVTGEQEFEGKRLPVANIAHEALIRHWALLGKWLKENREALLRKQHIEEAAKEWRDNRKSGEAAYLLRDTRLAAAEDYIKRYADTVPLSRLAQEFVHRSIKERKNSQRRLIGTVSAVIMGLSGLTGWALIESENNLITADSASSEALFASNKKFDALIEAIKAAKRLKQPPGSIGAKADTRMRVVIALQQAIYDFSKGRNSEELTEQSRIEEAIYSINISSDNQLIVSAKEDIIKLWNFKDKSLKNIWKQKSKINSVKFYRNNHYIAAAGSDGTIKIWTLNGTLLNNFQHSDSVKDFDFSPNGKFIVSVGFGGFWMSIWSIDGTLLKTIKADYSRFNSVRFSPDGQLIASIGASSKVEFWSLNGTLLKTWKVDDRGVVMDVSFSSDGQRIVTASGSPIFASAGRIKLWSRDGQLLKTFQGHNNMILDVSFSPDSKIIASASTDNTIKLWQSDGTLLETLTGHNNQVNNVSFSPDGQTLVSLGNDGTVRFWNRAQSSLKILKAKGWVRGISFSSDSQLIASVGGFVQLWNRNGILLKTLEGHSGDVNTVKFSLDGQLIASGSSDKTLKLWSRDGILIKIFAGYKDWGPTSVSFSPGSQIITSGDSDGTVKLWKNDGTLIKNFEWNSRSVSFSPDGQTIVSGGRDGTVKLWTSNGRNLKTLGTHAGEVWDVNFSPDGRTIASASADGTVKVWSRNGKLLTNLQGHSANVTCVSFSPDGQTIASGSGDRTIKLWSLNGTLLQTFNHNASVLDVSFSPDGKILASGSGSGQDDPIADLDRYNTIILWNLDLDDLMVRGCNRVRSYLNNPNFNLNDEYRHLCDGLATFN